MHTRRGIYGIPAFKEMLRILFLGAGATGGYYGARLAAANAADVSFLVRTRTKALDLERNGLRVISMFGDFTVRNIKSFSSFEDDRDGPARPYDVIFVCCKSYDLESACNALRPFISQYSEALVLPVLNGLSHMEYLDAQFGADRVIGGISHVATTMLGDGTIQQITPVHRITFGARSHTQTKRAESKLEKLKAAFAKTMVEVRLVTNINQELWEKFVLLATLASSTCLARAAVGDIMSTDEGNRIVLAMLDECISAAKHAGYPPRMELQNDVYKRLTEKGSVLTASMMRDMESGRPTEARHIIFDMMKRSRTSGNAATYLSVAWMVMQARDARLERESKSTRSKI